MKRMAVVFTVAVALSLIPTASGAVVPLQEIVSVELIGDEDTRFVVNGRPYVGPLRITLHGDGIALAEAATIEQYLQGIAEMPFSWEEEALAAQAVAARTYLTRRLLGGRKGDAATYGYDICATNRCQVYRGVQLVEGDFGDRWREAVASTENILVLYNGRPIEAVFTSMVGSRSSANQDVWSSAPVPYLQPVDSPEVGIAPYAEWSFDIGARQFVEILRAEGMTVGGSLIDIVESDPPEGEGRTEYTVITAQGTDRVLAPALKGIFNRHGDELYPGSLPGTLPNGKRLPEPLLSYSYDITRRTSEPLRYESLLPIDDQRGRDVLTFDGEGWGHGVGMSQWGAQIMAKDGATYEDILGHYYTGTSAIESGSMVPDSVVVGLVSGAGELTVTVEGSAQIKVNGVHAGVLPAGEWLLRPSTGGIALFNAGVGPDAPLLTQRNWPR